MATLQVSGNNASYTLTLSGMSTSTRYHVFIADLSSSGSVTGYKCIRSSLGSSSTWTYNGSSNSPYSNYGRSVYVYTSTAATIHSVGTIYTFDEMRSGCTFMDSNTIPAAGGESSDSYKIKVVFGAGIKQVAWQANSSSLTSGTLSSASFTVDVGQGGYLYISIARYAENFTYPVTASASSGTSSWTVINKNGEYIDHIIDAPSSPGTRTVTLTATEDLTYYYKVHAFANGGHFSSADETDYLTALKSSKTMTLDFDLSTLTTPTRLGYTFKGWGYASNATQYYTDTMQITVTSTSSGSPTIYNMYAIWEETEYNAYVKLGAGISSAMVLVDGVSKVDIRDNVYHRVVVNLTSTITIASIGLQSGYDPPYTVKFYASSTATTPSSSLSSSDTEVSYDYTTSRVYAEITATKGSIDLFYWDSASTDAALIAKGQPVSNITAARWNRLLAKIKELSDAVGVSFSYTLVFSGDGITAARFNAARTGLVNIRTALGTGTVIPGVQSSGSTVYATLFTGNGSLKSALNHMIGVWNNG